MKTIKITYWITTSLLTLALLAAGAMYFTNPEVAAGFTHLGFPDYFRKELGIAKIIAAFSIIIPIIPRNVREWTYAGIGIVYISAAIAHGASGDPTGNIVAPLVQLLILAVSYYTCKKMQALKAKPVVA